MVLGSAVLVLLLLTAPAVAFRVTLGWTPPTTYTDGSPVLPRAIAGYILYYGLSPEQSTRLLDVGNVTRATLADLLPIPYYVMITAYDQWGHESPWSSPPLVVLPPSGPRPLLDDPLIVTLTLPADHTSVTRYAAVPLSADVSDTRAVTMVLFFVDGTFTCAATVAPYRCTWQVPGVPRVYGIQAKAVDIQAGVSVSSLKTIRVEAGE